jgi:thiosulfate/3-mercaptopyruvate sulfurtransferase
LVPLITTPELALQLGNPNHRIVDIRPMAAYRGWLLQSEARGGHFLGAIAFPLSWTNDLDPTTLQQLVETKEITHDKNIVIYGYRHG